MGHHIPISLNCARNIASALWKIDKNSLLAIGDINEQRGTVSFTGKNLKQRWSAVRKVREEESHSHSKDR